MAQDTLYGLRFKKPRSQIFLDNYEQTKTKKNFHIFVDIPRETACEKYQRKETPLELELWI